LAHRYTGGTSIDANPTTDFDRRAIDGHSNSPAIFVDGDSCRADSHSAANDHSDPLSAPD
jgi:hypothetical protein